MSQVFWSELPSKDFKTWLANWDGSLMCGCDHRCNDWLKNNRSKASLVMRILTSKGNTSLDRVVQMSNERADEIFYWLTFRRDAIRLTRTEE